RDRRRPAQRLAVSSARVSELPWIDVSSPEGWRSREATVQPESSWRPMPHLDFRRLPTHIWHSPSNFPLLDQLTITQFYKYLSAKMTVSFVSEPVLAACHKRVSAASQIGQK